MSDNHGASSAPLSAAAASTMALSPEDALFNKYEIGKLLGCGAFAKVHHARDVATGRSVASKVINKSRLNNNANLMNNYNFSATPPSSASMASHLPTRTMLQVPLLKHHRLDLHALSISSFQPPPSLPLLKIVPRIRICSGFGVHRDCTGCSPPCCCRDPLGYSMICFLE